MIVRPSFCFRSSFSFVSPSHRRFQSSICFFSFRLNRRFSTTTSSSKSFRPRWTLTPNISHEKGIRRRMFMLPAATLNHMCLGAIFAWSLLNEPLTRLKGVVTSASVDWSLGDISVTFSLVMGGFVWGALLGPRLEQLGPRAACLVGSSCLLGGFSLAAAAAAQQSLPLLYAGGLVWGMANGFSYVPPVTTLMRWFPDRKGFASGACILGFGAGAAVAAPLFQSLLSRFRRAPEYLGATPADVGGLVAADDGRLFLASDTTTEVVVAAHSDVVSWLANGLSEGVYVVGTGSTGVMETFLVMGLFYSVTMAASSLVYRLPATAHPTSAASPAAVASPPPAVPSVPGVSAAKALRTPQFWIAYSGFGLAITGSYCFLSSGKTMLTDAFPNAGIAAASFVACMSFANLTGRLFWSNLSDFLVRRAVANGQPALLGRRRTFALMWGLSAPTYLLLLWSVHQPPSTTPGQMTLPAAVFVGSVCFLMAAFGGTTATRPALADDLFGPRNLSTITARQLSVVLPAALSGPLLVAYFRQEALTQGAFNLSKLVDEGAFRQAFGAGHDRLPELLDAKTVTVARLMELVPPGTLDPSAFAYDKTLLLCAGLQATAFLTNQTLTEVPGAHDMSSSEDVIDNVQSKDKSYSKENDDDDDDADADDDK